RVDAERRVREEEERKVREAQEFAMRERLEREKLDRDHRARIEESERRAKVEADAKLREQQMHLEMQMKAKHPPIKAIVTIVGALFVVVCGLAYYMYNQHQEEQQTARAKLAAEEEKGRKLQALLDETQREGQAIRKEFEGLQSQLSKATTQAERDAIQRRMDAVRAHAKANSEKVKAA